VINRSGGTKAWFVVIAAASSALKQNSSVFVRSDIVIVLVARQVSSSGYFVRTTTNYGALHMCMGLGEGGLWIFSQTIGPVLN
jgi:hypothetical protein